MNTIDFSEAGIIEKPVFENSQLQIICGGLTFLHNRFWQPYGLGDCNIDRYLSGLCMFKFSDIISYSIEYYDCTELINVTENTISLNQEGYSYAGIVFPKMLFPNECGEFNNYISVHVKTTSLVYLDINEKDLIAITEYCKNPDRYAFYNKL